MLNELYVISVSNNITIKRAPRTRPIIESIRASENKFIFVFSMSVLTAGTLIVIVVFESISLLALSPSVLWLLIELL